MIVGVDPGINGAIACLSGNVVVSVDDMPTYTIPLRGGKERKRVDAVELHEMFANLKLMGCELVVIEKVGGRPSDGGAAAFQFGWAAALVYMACVANKLAIHSVEPGTWKSALNVPGKRAKRGEKMTDEEKCSAAKMQEGAIMQRADEMFPEQRSMWRGDRGGKRLDRAEAVLLAVYGFHNVKGNAHDYKDADA